MKPLSRILLGVAALMLIGMYFLPMWSISLDAPQYPEGLGLKIYINTITGAAENDLTNINGLNHYIGMKRIEPDSIAELRYMPMIIGVMIALGLLSVWLGRRWMALAWSSVFVILGIVGITDFYLWEYDYGHNLDPHAAIVIPGMSYQPPLIGSKQLLNFTAHSYPDVAGYIAGASILLGFAAWWLDYRTSTKVMRRTRDIQAKAVSLSRWETDGGSLMKRGVDLPAFIFSMMITFSLALLTACEPKPEAIDWGKEECAHCKMNIADKRFAAQVLTTKGKAYKFDAIECSAAFLNEGKVAKADIHSVWVADYNKQGEFLNAKKSFFLQSEKLQSPMSLNIAAFPNSQSVKTALEQLGGNELYWDGVRLLVAKTWTADKPHEH
jgi:copper chaperone NosL